MEVQRYLRDNISSSGGGLLAATALPDAHGDTLHGAFAAKGTAGMVRLASVYLKKFGYSTRWIWRAE